MQLLQEDELIWSPTVANSRMNRQRNASGINSYEKEFKLKPEIFLESKIKQFGKASWLDLCCGEGNALLQTAIHLSNKGLQDKIKLHGIDLLDSFNPIDDAITCIEFKAESAIDWVPNQSYDLITCVHGLHYIGDKLKAIEMALAALNPYGLFVANLDLQNIIIDEVKSDNFLKTFFRKTQIGYKRKIIQRTGMANIKFGLIYNGANDKVGPNYTGQEAVTSYYTSMMP